MSKLEKLLQSINTQPQSLESLFSNNIEIDDDKGLSLEEINEVWGVDFSDPNLDVNDIPGAR